jgi:hypothetical protein
MPYFVYRITRAPLLRLDQLAIFAKFPEASAQAKVLRADTDPTRETIKVILADNELHAEDLLSQVREARPGSGAEE